MVNCSTQVLFECTYLVGGWQFLCLSKGFCLCRTQSLSKEISIIIPILQMMQWNNSRKVHPHVSGKSLVQNPGVSVQGQTDMNFLEKNIAWWWFAPSSIWLAENVSVITEIIHVILSLTYDGIVFYIIAQFRIVNFLQRILLLQWY